MPQFLTAHLVAKISLLGMGLDLLGGCYLAYDLLGGRHGPLRTIARAIGYMALFFTGYAMLLGLRYALVAGIGMGLLLAVEYRYAATVPVPGRPNRSIVILFGLLRGLVLGLAGMTVAGLAFGWIFGLLSGVGLSISYSVGLAPTDDYEPGSRPRTSRLKIVASVWRAILTGGAGMVAAALNPSRNDSLDFGLELGLAAGVVSALVGLFSPVIEWWIESLPERRLGLAGVVFIFAGMVLQSIQYWIVVLDVPVH